MLSHKENVLGNWNNLFLTVHYCLCELGCKPSEQTTNLHKDEIISFLYRRVNSERNKLKMPITSEKGTEGFPARFIFALW